MFTEYNDRHSNFVVLVICYEHKAIADAKKVTKNSGIEDKVTNGKASTSNGKAKIVRKWSEFRLPLNENQVLEWSQLPNNSELKFYHVPTFKHCIENGLDFVNYPNHVINDGQVLGKEELKQKDCYFVFTSDTYSIDFDPKKEEVKSKMISNFSHLFEIDTDTSLFYLEASDFDLNLAVKNYCASQRSKSLEDLFLLNSKNGKADIISLLLNVEFDKTCKNNLGMNALHLAVRYQHLDCVKLLLQSKLKNQLNGQDGIGNLPLHLACLGSNIPLVELLLKETRDITLKNVEKETILHSLCKGQANTEIFDPLFARICEHFDEDFTKYSKFFNLLNDDNESAFMIAVRKNHFHFVQHIVNSQLFSSLFNLNLKNKLGQSILIVACKEDAVQSLQILLPSCSQMIMEKDERGFTPLHYATLFNCLASSSLLLQYLDIQQYNTVLFHNSITPLEHAVSQNNIDLLRLHLNYLTNNSTPNSNIINHMPQLLFLCIKQHRSIEMVKEILQYQIDINQNTEGYVEYSIFETTTPKFPLLDCVLNDSKTIFKFLIRQPNINVNQQSKETGMTALHYAIIKHYLKPTEHSKYFIMKLIKKTDLSIQDHFLRTALHLSKLCEFKDISESIEALNESRYIKDLSDIPCKDYTKECSFANNLLFEKYAKYVTLLQTQSTSKSVNYKLLHGVYLQHEILNFLYTTKLSVNDLQSIYKRVSYLQKHLPSVHFIKHINLPIFPQLLNFKYENNNLHLVYSSNTLFEQTSSCRFYLDNNLLTHPIHQFSTMLKIISSIYVLHYSNITHGNIKPNSFRFVNDTKLLYIYDYGLLSNQLDEKQSSPEIKACKNGAIYDILAKKSNDIFNLGHVLHEVLFGSKYGEKDFSVTSIVQQLYSTIMACFTENEEFRPDIKEIYEAIKVTIQNLIEMLKESNNSKKDPARILEMELKLVDVMISRYGYNDHGKPQEMNATQNIGKCITKINELVKTEQLSILNVFNQMPEHLDINTIKQLFSTIHYLIQVLNDKFKAAAFDLLRVLLLKKECVEYLLTHHENLTLVDILERMKNVNNVDGFTLTLISSCIAHCLIHPIGLNYFTNHLDKYDLLVTFILQLLNSTTNQEKNVFNAAMILHNLRFNVQRIGDQLPPILADHLTILVQTQLNFPFIEKSETSQRNTRSLLETCVSTLNRLTSSLSNNTVAATSVSVVKDTVKLISLSLYSIIKLDSNCIPYLKNLNFQQLEPVIDYKLYNALFHLSLDFTNEEKEYVGLSSRILYKPSKD